MSGSTGEQNAVKLQSDDHEELLNIIDRLRSQGVSRFVDLPQLIVCGDQSSGKSSVLEAVSGVQFPTSDNLCTRFATELILRRGPEQPITFTIQSGERNSEPKRQKLGDFNARCDDVHKIADVIESAKSAMGLTGNSKNFSNEILRIEISGPVQPNLTLVDLPGLFHAGNKAQSTEEAEIVRSLVLSYMKKQRSIILAVVSAKNDYANQIVTRYASELDPNGLRTLGIITKPDTLPAGSDSERAFVELAENKDVNFRLGWHVLRNRDYDMRNASAEARDRKEAEFFSEGTWRTLPPSILGIGMLKPRLSNVLKDQILSELPSLVRDTQISLNDCIGRLSRLGVSRGNIKEQRDYLQKVGSEFSSLITAAIGGHYISEFFGSAMQDYGYNKRLRAVVQNTCVAFAEQIRIRGHAKDIRDTVPPTTPTPSSTRKDADVPPIVVRQEYMDEVEYLMARTRGCELPGTFNPHIVGELFFEQSRPWGGLVRTFMEKILNATTTTINLILEHVADPLTGDRLLRHVINPALTQIRQELDVKVKELLEPHQHGHPITYNHYFTDNLQKSRQEKFQQQIKEKLADYFGTYGTTSNVSVDVTRLARTLTQDTEKDMDRHACSEAIECMLAYYKVSAHLSLIELPYPYHISGFTNVLTRAHPGRDEESY